LEVGDDFGERDDVGVAAEGHVCAGKGVGGGKIFHGASAYNKDSWDFYFKPSGSKKHHTKHDASLPKSAWVPWAS